MTTATTPTVTDEQATVLAQHATLVQGGFSTPDVERKRILKDAKRQDDPQAFIDETVQQFAAELLAHTLAQAAEPAQPEGAPGKKAGQYEWMGEVLDIPREQGHRLLAEYRAAASALHAAKERAKAIEQEIQETLQGYEHGAIDGQQFFHWPYVDSTSFNVKAFKEDPQRKALYDSFLVTKPTRRFKVDGTVGVD